MDLARAQLQWLIELGADEAIGEAPVDRYAAPVAAPPAAPIAAPDVTSAVTQAAPVAEPASPAEAPDLAALAAAMEAAPSALKPSARRFVFAGGTPGASLMVVGEAPGRDDEGTGLPFSGPTGALLDLMLAAIGRGRASPDPARAAYLTNLLPWRVPPGGRGPAPAEVALFAPFLRRHMALARPRAVLLLGQSPTTALLGPGPIAGRRGTWSEVDGVPVLPSFNPSYLLNRPTSKREAWADLLAVRVLLDG